MCLLLYYIVSQKGTRTLSIVTCGQVIRF